MLTALLCAAAALVSRGKFRARVEDPGCPAHLTRPAWNDRMVETMLMTANSLRLTAYGPDEDEIRIVKDLPKAKTPREAEALRRQIAATDRLMDDSVYRLYGLSDEEIRIVKGERK
jgi:hypothetical protein